MKYLTYLTVAIFVSLVTSTQGDANNDNDDENAVSSDEFKAKMLPSTQRLLKDGCICYFLYAPICGSDRETYGNDCFLECAQRQDPYLLGICHGECPCCKKPYHNKPPSINGLFDDHEGDGWGLPPWEMPQNQRRQRQPPPYRPSINRSKE